MLVEAYRQKCHDGWSTGPNDGYFFQQLAWHITQTGDDSTLKNILFDFRWMNKKLAVTEVDAVINDFALLKRDSESALLLNAISAFSGALRFNTKELAGQLLGSLAPHYGPTIAILLSDARQFSEKPAILPLIPTLRQAAHFTEPKAPWKPWITTNDIDVTPDGKWMVSVTENVIRLWDLETATETTRWEFRSSVNAPLYRWKSYVGPIIGVGITADARGAIIQLIDGAVVILDLTNGREICRHHYNPCCLIMDTVTHNQRGEETRHWNSDTVGWVYSKLSGSFVCHNDYKATAAVITRDGQRGVVGHVGFWLGLYDLHSGRSGPSTFIRGMKGHTRFIRTLAVTADGRRLVSGSDDATVRLWDLETGAELALLTIHSGVQRCAIDDDGRRIVVSDNADRVHILEVVN